MRDELERAIRELESKLPELRRLIAAAEVELVVSPVAATLAPLLLKLVRLTDEAGSDLRRALLGSVGGAGEAGVVDDAAGPDAPPLSEAERDMAALMAELVDRMPPWQEGGPEPGQAYWEVGPPEAESAAKAETTGTTGTPGGGTTEVAASAFRLAPQPGDEDLWPTTFEEAQRLLEGPLRDAVQFYLDDEGETDRVMRGALEQAARIWEASEGDMNPLEVFARAAAFQVGLLLPRPDGKPERREPTERQLFAHLEWVRLEKLVTRRREQIEWTRANAREQGRDVSAAIAAMEAEVEKMVRAFYNLRLQMDDEDGPSGAADGPIGVPPTAPTPVKDPGAGRTFEEALAGARNP